MCIISELIENKFMEKIENGEYWENEYGICNDKSRCFSSKYCFQSDMDFKILLKQKKCKILFKIVPSFFGFPSGSQYWDFADGEVIDKDITFYKKRYK